MRPVALLPVPALLLLAACSAAQGRAEEIPDVPAGVEEQYTVLAEEVAERGGTVEQGDWTVHYIVEAAEPWFEQKGGQFAFREPRAGETHHIEIIPTESATGRIVPDVPVRLEVLDEEGEVVQAQRLEFLHSTFFHYANNFSIPEEGTYTLRATLGVPGFSRHGEEGDQPALARGATVEFADVELAP